MILVLQKVARPLIAFGLGYLTIVSVFAAVYGALWRLEGASAFSGLYPMPNFGDFAYFSLITAATVGYGDIAPRSPALRFVAGIEILVSLGWTIVVFAALMSIFGPGAVIDQTNGSVGAGANERPHPHGQIEGITDSN